MSGPHPAGTGGAYIPAWILHDPDLTLQQKVVYGRVLALCHKRGYCWASNDTLAEDLGVSARTVRRHVEKLCEKNHLDREVVGRAGGGSESRLFPANRMAGSGHPKGDGWTDLSAREDRTGRSTLIQGSKEQEIRGSNAAGEESELDLTAPPSKNGSGPPAGWSAEEWEVFEYWRGRRAEAIGKNGGPPMKASDGRRSKIRARLREGYTVDHLKEAVDGVLGSDSHVRGGHTGVDLIFRDQEHVERYRTWDRNGTPDFLKDGEERRDPSEGPAWVEKLEEEGGWGV